MYIYSGNVKLLQPNLNFIKNSKIIKLKLGCNYWLLYKNCNDWSLLFLNKIEFKQIMYEIHKLFKISTRVYFCKLRLKGLGFRALKITKGLYRFFFNQTNFFYFFAPSSILIIFKKRVLFFFGINFNILRITIAHLLLLKQLTMYRTRGLIYTRQIRILKPGKKRF